MRGSVCDCYWQGAILGECWKARNTSAPSRSGNRLGGVALVAGQEVFGDDLAGGIGAAAAAAPDRQLALNLEERAGTMIHGFADLAITHCMADAYVHLKPLIPTPLL
jgi:hypothetical protein